MTLKLPTGEHKLDANRQAIGSTFITEVVKDQPGQPVQQGPAPGRQRQPDARHAARRVQDRLARRTELPLISQEHALVLEGVTRNFGALRAIEDVSFSVAAGERRAVIGANGAGKTTLFNVITGDFPASVGRVLFFGEDVTLHAPFERIRMGLRRTYQSSLLFRDLSVRDNLFLAVRGVSRNSIQLLQTTAQPTSSTTCSSACVSRISPIPRSRRCRTASSASSRSAWRWPARRA